MFKRIVIVFFLIVGASYADVDSIKEGLELLNRGQTYESIRFFEDYLKNNPNDSDAHYYLGVCYKNIDDEKRATVEFQKAYDLTIGVKAISERENYKKMDVKTALKAGVDKDYYDLAQSYYQKGDVEMALSYLKLIDTINPENYEALYLRAFIEHYDGNTQNARTFFYKSLALNPAYKNSPLAKFYKPPVISKNEPARYDFDYYNEQGMKFYAVADYIKSKEYFLKALEFKPQSAPVYNNLGMLMLKKGDLKEAKRYLNKSISLNPKYSEPYINLAQLYSLSDNNRKELSYLKKAVAANQNNAVAQYMAGNYYLKKEEYDEAAEYYKNAIRLNKDFYEAFYSLGVCYFKTAKFADALTHFKVASELNPSSDKLNYYISKICVLSNRLSEAQDYMMRAVELKEDPDYLSELGKIYMAKGDFNEAKICFEDALSLKQNAEYYNYLGTCLYKLKDAQGALENFRNAVLLNSNRALYYYNLAQCYKGLKNNKMYYRNRDMAFRVRLDDYQDYIDVSTIYFDENNRSAALKTLNDGIVRYPDNVNLYTAKIKLYEAMGDRKKMTEAQKEFKAKFKLN